MISTTIICISIGIRIVVVVVVGGGGGGGMRCFGSSGTSRCSCSGSNNVGIRPMFIIVIIVSCISSCSIIVVKPWTCQTKIEYIGLSVVSRVICGGGTWCTS